MEDLLNKIDKLLIFFVSFAFIFKLFFATLGYTLPFVLAFLFAMLLKKPTLYLMRKLKFKSSTASLITSIIFFAIIISLLSLGIAALANEVIQLGKNLGTYFQKNSMNLNDFTRKFERYYNNLDPYIISAIEKNLSSITAKIPQVAITATGKVGSGLLSLISYIPTFFMIVVFTLLTTYFFTKDMCKKSFNLNKFLSENQTDKLTNIFKESKNMLVNYINSYLIIIGVTFIETLIVFLIFKVNYSFLLSVIAAIFDILPIVGIGTIYVPLIIYYLLTKNYFVAIGLAIAYAAVSIVRQIIEPKIVSSSLGIHPIAVLASIFIGLKLSGIEGMFFCLCLVLFYNLLKKVNLI